jgi:midasin (ATPase involved in ribosome maturation)
MNIFKVAFVNLHEDFYQAHKLDEYEISYANLSGFDYDGLLSFRESFGVIAENKAEAKFEREITVAPFDDTAFLPEYRNLIPAMPPEFVIPGAVRGICSAVTYGDARAILFHGPSGTGKTISCKLVCQEIGLPIMEVINCTENLDEFVLGKFIPEEDRIVFKESYVTKAIRYGGAVVFEEINFAKPQYLAFLNSLLDDNGFVRLDNGEVVRRHENFRFFATMNLGYFGTKELNQALYNRFNVVLELAALSDEAIAKMLTARVPECADRVDKLLSVYHKLKKKIDSEELDLVISPRNLENWARLAKYEGYIAAAEKTIIPIAKCDRVMEQTIRGILVLYKWQ